MGSIVIWATKLTQMLCILTIFIPWISSMRGFDFETEHDSDNLVTTSSDIFFEIVYPPELSYTYRIRPAQDFGTPFNSSFAGQEIALVPVEPETGCRSPDNIDQLRGNVALVRRGDCTFLQKSIIAEAAGAKAIIVADFHASSINDELDSSLWMDYYYIDMVSDETVENGVDVNIPVGSLLGKNGRIIRTTLRRLELPHAIINIPINLTFSPLTEYHQPPWVVI